MHQNDRSGNELKGLVPALFVGETAAPSASLCRGKRNVIQTEKRITIYGNIIYSRSNAIPLRKTRPKSFGEIYNEMHCV